MKLAERRSQIAKAENQKPSILREYALGFCPAAIAENQGLTKYGVRAVLIHAGITPRSKNAETLIRGEPHRNKPTAGSLKTDADQKQLYESGMPMAEIAAKYGTSKQAVQQRLKRAGAAMRPSGNTAGSGKDYTCKHCGQLFKRKALAGWFSVKHCSAECSAAAKEANGFGPRGETAGGAKLTDSKVLEIRRRLEAGESCTALAKEFLVGVANISHIKSKRSWKHLL